MRGPWKKLSYVPIAMGLLGAVAMAAVLLRAEAGTAGQSGSAGEITGKIYFKGDRPKLLPLDMRKDPVCQSEHNGTVYAEDGRVNGDGTLPNAFVYIKRGARELRSAAPSNSVELTQQGCMYEPHVLGIMVGQPLQVVTIDPTTHNVHVTPSANSDWNVTQEPGSPSIIRKFSKPEVMIPIHCNEHPWMKAYIGVMENPYFGVTGSDGSFSLKGVPAGTYTVAVWTATFGAKEESVTLEPGERASVDFTLEAQTDHEADESPAQRGPSVFNRRLRSTERR